MLFSFILIAGIADKLFAVLFPGAVAQTTTAQCLQSFAWVHIYTTFVNSDTC